MDDRSLPDSSYSQDGFHIRPSKWRFDLVRAQRERIDQTTGPLDLHENSKRMIQTVAGQVGRLIQEYMETAERIGAKIDQRLLSKIVEGLKREPLGNQNPLVEISDVTATERFLAESLYSEILEVSRVTGGTSGDDAPLLAPEEWQACLEILADSIPTAPSPDHDDD